MLEAPFTALTSRVAPSQGDREPGVSQLQRRAVVSAEEASVCTIMSTAVVRFAIGDTVDMATRVMLERGISGAPVVDAAGRPIGMVSKTDLLEAWHEHGDADAGAAFTKRNREAPAGAEPCVRLGAEVVVGDIMVPYLLGISKQAPISLAATLMAYEGVHRLLVLDENNQMVGIVSALDVLRWLAQLSGFCLPRYTQRQRG